MKVPKVEDLVKMSYNKELLKKTIGDGPEFDLVYETLLNKMQSDPKENNGEVSEEYIAQPTGAGVRIDKLPMRIRKENEVLTNYYKTNENVNIENINLNIDNVDNSERINNAVNKYSKECGVDRNLILAIIKQESNFDPNVESGAGAKGLMQLMDFNCEAYGVTDPFNIEQNIKGGVNHIKEYLDMFDGNVEMALMAYNGGPGTMQRRGVTSTSDLYKMPGETQAYVPKVMNYYKNGF
ncbi:lytic transglycosylase domain-containing protein [Clostridium chauvoei]|nr:lytic transglycosylase domain-containing protein [Clostridium chauvoei]ATD55988.1 lytic transglycosylase [Clostridium chauvoei]ATD56343.1 lytic transglycosylase [Clostridium chauvoei]CDG00550.1 Putative Lytic murein transglycosylase [Clostridium chauvoei JF4335]SLK22414.1 Putative Lytic murein transglycosylase [Clostridium chauvoei JF4335]